MPRFIIEQAALKELVKPELGGQANPFKDDIEWLDKAEGRWDRDNTLGQGRKTGIQVLLEQLTNHGVPSLPAAGKRLYRSKEFDPDFLPLLGVAGIFQMLGNLNFYGDLVDYYTFVKLDDTQYAADTPAILPASTRLTDPEDPESPVIQMQWSEWRNNPPYSTHLEHEGYHYIDLLNPNGYPLCGSVVAALYGSGVPVLPKYQWPVISSGEV